MVNKDVTAEQILDVIAEARRLGRDATQILDRMELILTKRRRRQIGVNMLRQVVEYLINTPVHRTVGGRADAETYRMALVEYFEQVAADLESENRT